MNASHQHTVLHVQGESFQKFLNRPENQPVIEAMQRKQSRKSMKAQEIQSARDFQSKVNFLQQECVYFDCSAVEQSCPR